MFLSNLGSTIGCTSFYVATSPVVTSALALSTAMNCFKRLLDPVVQFPRDDPQLVLLCQSRDEF